MSKAKFKVGDRVRIIGNTNASRNKIGELGTITEIEVDSCRVLGDETKNSSSNWTNYSEIELVVKTLDNLEVGDELINSGGDIIYVLGVCGRIIFTSSLNMPNKTESYWTKEELEDYWTVKSAQSEPIEMTVSEIAEKLGHEVKVIKEK